MLAEVCMTISSISRHCGINGLSPSVNPTVQVVDIFKSIALQEMRNLKTAGAMMADHDDCCMPIKRIDGRRHGIHGNVNRIFNMTDLKFPRLAHIQQYRFGTIRSGQPVGKFAWVELIQGVAMLTECAFAAVKR